MEETGVQSKMVAPILQRQSDGSMRVWGLLITHACATPRRWQPDELDLLQQVAEQLAIALHQAELHQQLQTANQELERISNTDALTQIANRRYFDRSLAQEWQRAQREQMPLALILCDIDFFKQYNDTYGHPAGDVCITAMAQVLQAFTARATVWPATVAKSLP
jgi:PleD family two-component response regulator